MHLLIPYNNSIGYYKKAAVIIQVFKFVKGNLMAKLWTLSNLQLLSDKHILLKLIITTEILASNRFDGNLLLLYLKETPANSNISGKGSKT